MGQWEVIAAVGTELDLPEPVRFGNVFLGNPPRSARVRLPPDPVLPDVPGRYVVTLQQMTRICTSTFYWVVVEAEGKDDAVRAVERYIDPIVSVGLSLVVGHDVATQILQVSNLGSSEPPMTAWGGGGQLTRLDQRRPDRSGLAHLLDALRQDQRIAGCLPYLTRATKYLAMTTPAGHLAVDAALLELAKALEYLVRKSSTAADEKAPTDTARIIAGLTKTLTSSKGIRRKSSAITKAARSLQRLERRTVSGSVRSFAAQHDLGPRWTSTAVRLIEVRNKHLAHPGERMTKADRAALSEPENGARSVVHAAVRVLLQSQAGLTIPSAPISHAAPAGDVTLRWKPGLVAEWLPTTERAPDDD